MKTKREKCSIRVRISLTPAELAEFQAAANEHWRGAGPIPAAKVLRWFALMGAGIKTDKG